MCEVLFSTAPATAASSCRFPSNTVRLIMAAPLAEFEPVLRAFLGIDDNARAQANHYLVQLRNSSPDTLLLSLVQVWHKAEAVFPASTFAKPSLMPRVLCCSLQVLRHGTDVALRSLAPVLIRRSLFSDDSDVLGRTSPEVRRVLRAELLAAIQAESDNNIRRIVR